MKQKLISTFELEFLNENVRSVDLSGFINPSHIVFFEKNYFTYLSTTYIQITSVNGSQHYIKYSDFTSTFL